MTKDGVQHVPMGVSAGGPTLRALLAGDGIAERGPLSDALRAAGFAPVICSSVAAARSALREHPFDVFVFDLELSEGRGLELVADVRGDPTNASRPVIVVSVASELRHRLRGLRAGANEFLGKPYASELVARRAAELATGRRSPASAPGESGPGRVLVIDDSPTYGNALAEELRRDRHDVVLASSGAEGLELLELYPVECVLLDVFMPGMNGMDVYRTIRSEPAWADIPVLMLTGRKDSAVKDAAVRAGVDDFYRKSVDLGRLRLRVNDVLGRPRQDTPPRGAPTRRPQQGALPAAPSPEDLMTRAIAACGLSDLLARSIIERACRRAGVDPQAMTAADLEKVTPHMERFLGLFLPRAQVEERVQAIAALARRDRST